jgi:hypothetical protein
MAPGLMGQTIGRAEGSKRDAPRSCRRHDPGGCMGITVRLRNLVSRRPGSVLCFILAVDDMAPSFARGHAERRCSGACPQQARSSSALARWEGPVHGLCPGPGSGKRRPRQLRRSTRLRAGSASRGQVPPKPEQAGRVEMLTQRHARCRPCVAVGLPTLARPGEGNNQGAPSGRRLPPEGGLAWS